MLNTKKILSFSIGPLGGAILGFITLPIATWIFPVSDIGRLSMFQVVISLSTLIFCLGLDQAFVREYHESEDRPALLKATLLPGLCTIFIVIFSLWSLPFRWSIIIFSVNDSSLIILLVISMLSAFISRFLSLILRMQERGIAYSMSQLLPKCGMLCFLVAYYLSDLSLVFFDLALAFTSSQLLVLFILLFNTKKEWQRAIHSRLDSKHLVVLLKFGTPLVFGAIAYWGMTASDRFFLRSFATFNELGLYSVSVSFAAAAVILQSVFSTIWAPTVYKWAANGVDNKKIEKVTDIVLFVVLIMFSIVGLFSWLVVYILPSKYSSVQYIVVSCLSLPLLYTLSETTVVGIAIKKKTKFVMFASFITLVINVIGLYIFVPVYGATGAAVSTAISFWVFLFLRTEFSARIWYSFPRKKIYTSTLFIVCVSCFNSLFGSEYKIVFITLWLLIFSSVLAFNFNYVVDLCKFIFSRRKSNSIFN